MPDDVFLCGYKPKGQRLIEQLEPEEQKLVRNFSRFLRGKGKRCPQCLHKAIRHQYTQCDANGCDCTLDYISVIAVRAQVKAKGWEND